MPEPVRSADQEAIALGEARYRAGAYGEAAAIFAQVTEQSPSFPTALRLFGLCRLRLGDPSAALELLGRARDLAPDDPFAQLHYGLGLYEVGRHAEAASLFRTCQVLLPDDPAPPLNLAAAALALGDKGEALTAAHEAKRRAPRLPQAHYMLGVVQLAAEQLDDAEEAFRAAVQLSSGFADAWVNLGLVRYRRSDMEGAKAAMRRALAAAPGHRAATANLGAFLRLTGEAEAGEALLRKALARDPGSAEARLNLAAELLQEERAAEALTLLDAVPAPAERRLFNHWQAQRALALLQLGQPTEARQTLDTINAAGDELTPLLLWRRVLLASAEGDRAGARAFAEQMETALGEPVPLVPEHNIMSRFDLAKFWSWEGDADRAFSHWIEGHAAARPIAAVLAPRLSRLCRCDDRAFRPCSAA